MKSIELITPCFNEEKCVELFLQEAVRVFKSYMPNYELIITYVDDGSKDGTLSEIKRMVAEHPEMRIRYISFSRNFGKESAIYAGMTSCVGDYVVLLDVDLQHPITLIPEMLKAVEEEGYDCATARRISRKGEPKVRSFLSSSYYHVFNRLTSINMAPGSTDFRLMKKKVAKSIASLTERERFTKGIYSWVGYKNKWIEYKNVERAAGSTKWSLKGLMRYSYSSFMAFATTPLRGAVWLGMFIVLADVIWILDIAIHYLKNPVAFGSGYAKMMVLILFLGGVIITLLGLIGEYLARIYMEVKNRPIFITRDTNISDEERGLSDKEE